jgi:hypothetical protein
MLHVDGVAIPGLTFRETPRGYLAIRLEFIADETKRTKAFEKSARMMAGSDKDYRREFLIDWRTSAGDSVFPEYAEIGEDRYVLPPELRKLFTAYYVERGLDLGGRAPSCTWLQYISPSDRVLVQRVFAPRRLAAHFFRDAVMWLSGELECELEALHQDAQDAIIEACSLPETPQGPWYPRNTRFRTWTGPEANYTESIALRDPNEKCAADVWQNAGVPLEIQTGPAKDPLNRRDLMQRLLPLREDGWPGILIHPCCHEVIGFLAGGLAYSKPTSTNPKPKTIRKDGRWDNTFDSCTYAMVSVVPTADVVKVAGERKPVGSMYLEPMLEQQSGCYETSEGWSRP